MIRMEAACFLVMVLIYLYPSLRCEYDIDTDLGGMEVPNFILQPLVENSLLHGLKNRGK